ncbi:MAG: hypothetical protein CVV24_02885 [Ignavibacteriae bacterium HGW-Ignavibacteriae-3]|nr:MAG: hypothetical protein CVV24_02885 [Ignavibacteriae bacterium HGW-Ignavibacteriae-3]
MENLKELISNQTIFFSFMKEKYYVFYNSNIFFRDIQYAIKSYLEKKNKKVKYSEAEKIAEGFIAHMEKDNQLIKMSENAWKVNFSLEKGVIQPDEVNAV